MSDNLYTWIKGTYHIFYPDAPKQGPQPDGDTITFQPDDQELVLQLGNVHVNGRGMVSIRFEAIDALETHYSVKGGGMVHQQQKYAYKARDFMLSCIGFENIVFWDENPNKVKSANPYKVPGYIAANEVDVYGRVIAFVYEGNSNIKDGDKKRLDYNLLWKSANGRLLENGLVYPAFYTSLPSALVEEAAKRCKELRSEKIGLWGEEDINTVRIRKIKGMKELEELILLPKLFRRLAVYFGEGYDGLGEVMDWLKENAKDYDDSVILPGNKLGNLHDLFEVNEGAIKLKYEPEDIIIVSK